MVCNTQTHSLDAQEPLYRRQRRQSRLCAPSLQDAPPVVLVHGYGASAYHWRYNIPELAKQYRV